VLKLFVRAGNWVISALELGSANEDAAVRVRGGAKLEFQNEIFRELASGPEHLNFSPLSRRSHNQPAVFRHIATIIAGGLALEIDGVGDDRPRRSIWIALSPASCCLDVGMRGWPVSPPGQIVTVEQ